MSLFIFPPLYLCSYLLDTYVTRYPSFEGFRHFSFLHTQLASAYCPPTYLPTYLLQQLLFTFLQSASTHPPALQLSSLLAL